MNETTEFGLERKFCRPDVALSVEDGRMIEGYASVFGAVDQGGDVVEPGAYQASLDRLASSGRRVKMLWQHDPTQPIGVWDEVREDGRGLYVKGHYCPAWRKRGKRRNCWRRARLTGCPSVIARCGRRRTRRGNGTWPSWNCGKSRW